MASFGDQIRDFSETSTGRIVVVAVPVAILIAAIGVVAFFMLGGGPEQKAEETATTNKSAKTVKKKESKTVEETSDTSAADTGEDESTDTLSWINEDYEVYDTRDPFKSPDVSSTVTGIPIPGGSVETTVITTNIEILTLNSIEEDADGTQYANVTYGSSPYLVKEGERVGSSPFEVLTISANSVTFLYGDDQIVLTIGDSVDK